MAIQANVTLYSNVPSGNNAVLGAGLAGATAIQTFSGIQYGYPEHPNSSRQNTVRLPVRDTAIGTASHILIRDIDTGWGIAGAITSIAFVNAGSCSVNFQESGWYTLRANGIIPNAVGLVERATVLPPAGFRVLRDAGEPFAHSDIKRPITGFSVSINNFISAQEGSVATWRYVLFVSERVRMFLELLHGSPPPPFLIDPASGATGYLNISAERFFDLDTTTNPQMFAGELVNGFPLAFSNLQNLRNFITNITQSGLGVGIFENQPAGELFDWEEWVNSQFGGTGVGEWYLPDVVRMDKGKASLTAGARVNYNLNQKSLEVTDTTTLTLNAGGGSASNIGGTLNVSGSSATDTDEFVMGEVENEDFPSIEQLRQVSSIVTFDKTDLFECMHVPQIMLNTLPHTMPHIINDVGLGNPNTGAVDNLKFYAYPYTYYSIRTVAGGEMNIIPQIHMVGSEGSGGILGDSIHFEFVWKGGNSPKLIGRVTGRSNTQGEALNDNWFIVKEFLNLPMDVENTVGQLQMMEKINSVQVDNAVDRLELNLGFRMAQGIASGAQAGAATGAAVGASIPKLGSLAGGAIGLGAGALGGVANEVINNSMNYRYANFDYGVQLNMDRLTVHTVPPNVRFITANWWQATTQTPVMFYARGATRSEMFSMYNNTLVVGEHINMRGEFTITPGVSITTDSVGGPNYNLAAINGRVFWKFYNVNISNVPHRYAGEIERMLLDGCFIIV